MKRYPKAATYTIFDGGLQEAGTPWPTHEDVDAYRRTRSGIEREARSIARASREYTRGDVLCVRVWAAEEDGALVLDCWTIHL